MNPVEMRQLPQSLLVRRGVPRSSRRLYAEEGLQKGIVDRPLLSVALMQAALVEARLLPTRRRFLQRQLRTSLHIQLLSIDLDARCALGLAKQHPRHPVARDL